MHYFLLKASFGGLSVLIPGKLIFRELKFSGLIFITNLVDS